jgi:hypothetical protein
LERVNTPNTVRGEKEENYVKIKKIKITKALKIKALDMISIEKITYIN